MQINCPKCGVDLASDPEMRFSIISCHSCKHELICSKDELPEYYKMYTDGDDFVIEERCQNKTGILCAVMVLFVILSIITFMLLYAVKNGNIANINVNGCGFAILLFSLIFFLILFCIVFIDLLNIKEMRLNKDHIFIKTYPFPFGSNKALKVSSIEKIGCKKSSIANKNDLSSEVAEKKITYEFIAILEHGLVTLDTFCDLSHARAYEAIIKNRLGIKCEIIDSEFDFTTKKPVSVSLPSYYKVYIDGRDLVISKTRPSIVEFIPSMLPGAFVIYTFVFKAPIGIIAVSICLFILALSFTMTIWCDKKEIRVNDKSIIVKNHTDTTFATPNITAPKKRVIDSSIVEQLYCKESIRKISGYKRKTSEVTVFELIAKLKDGGEILLHEFYDMFHARAYETFIEKRLGIKDKPVDGEYKD